MNAKLRVAAALGIAVVAADQATKTSSSLFDELPAVDPTTNPSFALGVARSDIAVMVVVSAIGIVVFGAWAARRTADGRLAWWVPALLIGGAISNLIDRVVLGSVRDFLALPFATANLADLAIVAGLVGLKLGRRRSRSCSADDNRVEGGGSDAEAHPKADRELWRDRCPDRVLRDRSSAAL